MYLDYFMKQKMMRKVLIALTPIYLFSLYLYGLHVIWLSIFTLVPAILLEYLFEKKKGKKISEAVFVTSFLYILSLPPNLPVWMASIGISFGIIFAKEAFGGFGRNIFNPAIVARLFTYLAFPTFMTTFSWLSFGHFGAHIDTVTQATPLYLLKHGESLNLWDLFMGFHTGSIGESSILLILIGAIYLLYTKTAKASLMFSSLLSYLFITCLLFYLGVENSLSPLQALFSGSIVFVSVFMVTDPVTAPKKPLAMWIYGIIIGTTLGLLRLFNPLFPEVTSFAILIGNVFASLLDDLVPAKKKK